jgi:hypothetical protein
MILNIIGLYFLNLAELNNLVDFIIKARKDCNVTLCASSQDSII